MLGRPPLQPRIEALERLNADAQVRIAQLEIAVLELTEKLCAVPTVQGHYEQQFTKWPGKSIP
jgi:hypothetical protein